MEEERQSLLVSEESVEIQSPSSWSSRRKSKLVLYLFLSVGVACLVVAGAIGFSSYVKSDSAGEEGHVTISSTSGYQIAARAAQYRFAAVAPDANCSDIGTKLMAEKRASAVDAAIATLLCNEIRNSHSLGLGGGFFMTIYDRPIEGTKKEFHFVDAREVAPLAAHKYMYTNTTASPEVGGSAIAVPGMVAGLWAAWNKFGRVPWKELFQPSIELARNGFRIDNALSNSIRSKESIIKAEPSLSEIFLKEDGSRYKEGEIMKRTKLADTLEKIANEGGDSYYTGSLQEDVLKDLQEHDSIITAEDLENYQPVWREPIKMKLNHGNYTLYGAPPPASSLILEFVLNILDGFKMDASNLDTYWDKVRTYHRIIEAFKFAYAKRTDMGDPAFVDNTKLIQKLTSYKYAALVRSQISDDATHEVPFYHPDFEVQEDHGTSHTSILAPDGAAVSVTGTINNEFGCKKRGTRTGIIFNDQMADFSLPDSTDVWGLPPAESNFIEPGKKPVSSISATIILDSKEEVKAIIGASGGTKITTGVAFTLVHYLWLGYPIENAISLARLHHQLVPNQVSYESSFPKDILDGLHQLGHVLSPGIGNVVQAITRSCDNCKDNACRKSCVTAVCDTRKDGIPDGF